MEFVSIFKECVDDHSSLSSIVGYILSKAVPAPNCLK